VTGPIDDEALVRALRAIAQPEKPSRIPGWPPRDWRAFVALLGSVAGAAVLTAFAAWLVWILWKGGWPLETADKRIEALAWALLGILATVGIVLVGLGMAINRRTVKGKAGLIEFEASGGDEAQPAATATTTTTVSVPVPPAPPGDASPDGGGPVGPNMEDRQ
jgi:hypothetical protein